MIHLYEKGLTPPFRTLKRLRVLRGHLGFEVSDAPEDALQILLHLGHVCEVSLDRGRVRTQPPIMRGNIF